MTDVTKLRFRTARLWITYVLRLMSYLVVAIGGAYALFAPPDTIVRTLGTSIVCIMAICLLLGAAAALVGWGTGRWIYEQCGVIAATAGAALYFCATIMSPDIVTLGGGLRLALTLYVGLSLVLRAFEIERYTSIVTVPGRVRLDSR